MIMLINTMTVHFEMRSENDLLISIGTFQGIYTELLDFRRSFDYECYTFGSSRFTAACWKVIRADDYEHCKYPLVVYLKSDLDDEMVLNWSDLNDLISSAALYLKEFYMSNLMNKLSILMADTYALYLKTQNYHWHVKGPHFKPLHDLFEVEYRELAEAVDAVAERMLMMGHKAPATFKEFEQLKTIKDGNSELSSNQMVTELAADNAALVIDLNHAMVLAQKAGDEGTVNLLSERIAVHQKAHWMLGASREA